MTALCEPNGMLNGPHGVVHAVRSLSEFAKSQTPEGVVPQRKRISSAMCRCGQARQSYA